MMNKHHATYKKKTNELFLRNQRKRRMDERTNEQTNGRMDKTEIIGPFC